jgi:NTP pyrophosphatase (non-canonical NTP hydrolase)
MAPACAGKSAQIGLRGAGIVDHGAWGTARRLSRGARRSANRLGAADRARSAAGNQDRRMNLSELQAELRRFAADRDWQPFHTPKNLATALMVEAAELAEIYQWMTPEQSQAAHLDPALKRRVGEEVADVLLYLLQVADHGRIDIAQAVRDKLARNALKYPVKKSVARDA